MFQAWKQLPLIFALSETKNKEAKWSKKKNTEAKRSKKKNLGSKRSENIYAIFLLWSKMKNWKQIKRKKSEIIDAKFFLKHVKLKRNQSHFNLFLFEVKRIWSENGAPYSSTYNIRILHLRAWWLLFLTTIAYDLHRKVVNSQCNLCSTALNIVCAVGAMILTIS